MKHFIYKTYSKSGKFYIGRHSTRNIDDGYLGSGKWVLSIKNKDSLSREILEYAKDPISLKELERKYISEHINYSENMNFNNEPIGFASGRFNPMKHLEVVKQVVKTRTENGSYIHSDETKKKISAAHKGKKCGPSWNKGLTKHTDTRVAELSKKISNGVSKWMSTLTEEQRKTKFGNTGEKNGFFNKTHSTKTIDIMKQAQQENRKNKITCEHCNKAVDKANFSRWHGNNCKHE